MSETNKIRKMQMPDKTILHVGASDSDIRIQNQYIPGCVNDGYTVNGTPSLVNTSGSTFVNKAWTLPTYTSNTTYGSITASTGGSAYTLFGSGSYTPGTNWVGTVTFTWTVPEMLNLTGFKYRTKTVSDSSYSTRWAKFYGWDYSTSAWVLMGSKSTSGDSDYTDTYDVKLSHLPTDKFRIQVYFNGHANLPAKVHDIRPYGYKWVEAGAGDISFNVDDGTNYKPLTATFHDGETKVFPGLNTLETSGLENGTYGVWLTKDGELELNQLGYYVGTQEPADFTTGTKIWKDVGNIPYKCYQSIDGVKTEVDKVRLVKSFALTDGAIENVNLSSWGFNNSSMPSNHYVDLTLGAYGSTYTAPANGWAVLSAKLTSGKHIEIYNDETKIGATSIFTTASGHIQGYVSVPCKKGDIFTIYHNSPTELITFRFIYAQGEV